MSKSEDQKVQSKMRSRQSISRNHGKKSKREEVRTAKGIEAQARGERAQLECKPKHKTNDKDQDKKKTGFYTAFIQFCKISIFRIGRSVMEVLSSI